MSNNMKTRLLAVLEDHAERNATRGETVDALLATLRDLGDADTFRVFHRDQHDRNPVLSLWRQVVDQIASQELPGDEFAGAPETIGELRARKTERPDNWKPRDLLIRLLRRIDEGEEKPVQLIVIWVPEIEGKPEREHSSLGMALCTLGPRDTVGILEMAKMNLQKP